MRQVNDWPLWIGHAGNGRDVHGLLDARIEAIVQLACEEAPLCPPREFIYVRIPLRDGAGNEDAHLSLAIGAVARLVEQGVPTLVCCGAGMSRSPAIVAAALAKISRVSAEDGLKLTAGTRPIDIAPGLWVEVVKELAALRESGDR